MSFWGSLVEHSTSRLEALKAQDLNTKDLPQTLKALCGEIQVPAETEGSAISNILGWLCSKGGEGSIPAAALNVTQGTDSPDRMRPPHDLHEKLMQLILQAEVPCMKWREIPSGVGSVIAIPPDIDGPDPHDPRAQLQHWAGRQLSQPHREAGPPLVHQQILRAAAQRKISKSPSEARPEWWRLVVPLEDLKRSFTYASVLFVLAPDNTMAWNRIKKAFWHGMAVESCESSRPDSTNQWHPNSFERCVVDLQQLHSQMIDRAIRTMHVNSSQDPNSPMSLPERESFNLGLPEVSLSAGPGSELTMELQNLCTAMTPATYLQLIGQTLLYQASQQLPVLASLPDTVKDDVIQELYTKPFVQAINMAFATVCENPEQVDPTPFNAKAVDEVGKRWRTLGPTSRASDRGSVIEDGVTGSGKNGLKTILNILKSICKDVHDFEHGLATILDQDPGLLPTSPQEDQEDSLWQLRSLAIKSRVRLDLDAALRSHQSAMGALLLTFMTQSVRGMLRASSKTELVQEDVRSDIWAPLDFSLDKKDAFNDDKPRYIDGASHQVLIFILGSMYRLPTYPATIQAVLAVAVLESLSLLLDRLGSACVPAYALPGDPSHAPRTVLLYHGSACCVRRRLLTFRSALEVPIRDEFYEAMIRGYANTLLQAEDIVSRLARQLVALHSTTTSTLTWHALDQTDWASYRRPIKWAPASSSAPRVWRCSMARLVLSLAQLSSVAFGSWVLSQVIQEGLSSACARYLALSPSSQRLPQYVADVLHIAQTAFVFTQRLEVPDLMAFVLASNQKEMTKQPPQQQLQQGPSQPQGSSSTTETQSRQAFKSALEVKVGEALRRASTTMGGSGEVGKPPSGHEASSQVGSGAFIKVPEPVVLVIAEACKTMCTHAALMSCRIEELAGLLGVKVSPTLAAATTVLAPESITPPPVGEDGVEGPSGRPLGESDEENKERIDQMVYSNPHPASNPPLAPISTKRLQLPPIPLTTAVPLPALPTLTSKASSIGSGMDSLENRPRLLDTSGTCWSWLPAKVRKELLVAAAGLLPVEQLIHGFNPLHHMDLEINQELTGTWKVVLSDLVQNALPENAASVLRFRHELHAEVPGLPYSEDELAQREMAKDLAAKLM